MPTRSRSIGPNSAALLIAAGVFVARPQTADAATCYGVSCRGLDPQATSCNTNVSDAGHVVFTKGGSTIGYLFRYYSATCDAYFGMIQYLPQPYELTTPLTVYIQANVPLTINSANTNVLLSKMWTYGKVCGTMQGIGNCT